MRLDEEGARIPYRYLGISLSPKEKLIDRLCRLRSGKVKEAQLVQEIGQLKLDHEELVGLFVEVLSVGPGGPKQEGLGVARNFVLLVKVAKAMLLNSCSWNEQITSIAEGYAITSVENAMMWGGLEGSGRAGRSPEFVCNYKGIADFLIDEFGLKAEEIYRKGEDKYYGND